MISASKDDSGRRIPIPNAIQNLPMVARYFPRILLKSGFSDWIGDRISRKSLVAGGSDDTVPGSVSPSGNMQGDTHSWTMFKATSVQVGKPHGFPPGSPQAPRPNPSKKYEVLRRS